MHTGNKSIRQSWLRIVSGTGLLLLMTGLSLAQQAAHKTFPSAEEASHALFAAVQNNNEQAIVEILGGQKDLASSGDTLDDERDREIFAQKYEEMHRLVEEPDGTTTLYVGAENWPFPIPLTLNEGKWYFDADAGAKEVLFRRVGENETSTIAISPDLASSSNKRAEGQGSLNASLQYARTLINSGAEPSSTDSGTGPTPLNGYYFRKLETANAGTVIVAYPAEYRSSGVKTFVATPNGVVFEKDLGSQTASIAKAMTTWKQDRRWKIVKGIEQGN